ncbi:NAD(P)-binding protein [Fusarium austroafricanum]|uniref:NAD(P)-binding protein n=1 Tax=Fusarium austroafricanum TaxID=2364996 RepID=A0A8H4KCP9_9HYPO|nr:NAD(P)-binding protein [Fusarium austroafricanum]
MPSTLIALILGSGPRVGASVAKAFSEKGYKVAVVSRSGSDSTTSDGYLSLKADLANLDAIPAIFERVEKEWKVPPSVVVWNAGVRTVPLVENDMFSLTQESLIHDMNINTLGLFIAAQKAVAGWKKLPDGTKKTFVYTGNKMNVQPVPMAATVTLGLGKAASSSWVQLSSMVSSDKSERFFYADQRTADGLVQHETDAPRLATSIPGTGYVKF